MLNLKGEISLAKLENDVLNMFKLIIFLFILLFFLKIGLNIRNLIMCRLPQQIIIWYLRKFWDNHFY